MLAALVQPTSRGIALVLAPALVVSTLIWAGLEYRFRDHFPGFPSARTPSLRLSLSRALGRQKFYSQLGQDLWVIGVVYPGVKHGYFVDIGAGDGTLDSNTKAVE